MEKSPKISKKYICDLCEYNCCKQSELTKHFTTLKHQKRTNLNNLGQKNLQQTNYSCKQCNKEYTSRNGLWYHEKKCNTCDAKQEDNNITVLTNLVVEVVKSNSELQKQNEEFKSLLVEQNNKVIDIYKNGVNTNTTNNTMNNTINNNSNNKSFNLNVFLNETCKDAMNMKDFVDSIQITLTDIENMGKLGFVNGISNIIVNRLKAIDVHLRPVHCTDQRRETMYVKEKNQWSKEEEDNKNIRRFIQLVAHKNTRNLNLFKNKHPDCLEYHSKYNDQYNKIVMETFGGYGNTDYDSENKIIRKLVKELAIDKSN